MIITTEMKKRIELSQALVPSVNFNMWVPQGLRLKSFQTIPAIYAREYNIPHLLIGDDPGLGKSYEALLCVKQHFSRVHNPWHQQCLIICPGNKTFDWRRDLELWEIFGEVHSIDLWKSKSPEDQYKSVDRCHHLIMDEIHMVKNPESLRTENVMPWYDFFERTTSLSGSMPPNYNSELYPYLERAMPQVVNGRSYEGFMNYFCQTAHKKGQPDNKFPIGSKNEEELYTLLRSNGMVRRTFDECLPHMPKPDVRVRYLSKDRFDEDERKIIDKELAEGASDAQKQGHNSKTSKLIAQMKVPHDVALVKRYMDTHRTDQVVIIGTHREALEAIAKSLGEIYKVELLIGGATEKNKFQIKEKFLEKKIDIVVGNYDVMGVGMDFQSANFVLLAHPDWKPDKHKQGIGRVRRFGQVKQVVAVFSIIRGSLEEKKFKTAARKELGIIKTLDNPKGV